MKLYQFSMHGQVVDFWCVGFRPDQNEKFIKYFPETKLVKEWDLVSDPGGTHEIHLVFANESKDDKVKLVDGKYVNLQDFVQVERFNSEHMFRTFDELWDTFADVG